MSASTTGTMHIQSDLSGESMYGINDWEIYCTNRAEIQL